MLLIQLFLAAFFLFAIGKVVGRYRAREISLRATFFWVIFWIVAGFIVMLPDSTMYAAKILGVGRGVDLVVYLSLAFVFFALFRLMVKNEQMRREITKLTREVALLNMVDNDKFQNPNVKSSSND